MLTIAVPNEGASEKSNYSFSVCVLPGGQGLVLSSLDKASLLLIKAEICQVLWQQANRRGNSGNNDRLLFGEGPPKSLQMVTAAMKLKDVYSLEEKL